MTTKPIIGIPVKGDEESFLAMMISLLESTDYFDKIVITTPDELGDISILNEHPKLGNGKLVIIKKNFKTPLEAYNALFDYAKEKNRDLFITQTDVLFPKLYKRDWLELMSSLVEKDIGAVTCLNGYGISGPDYVDGFPWLGGWCTYYTLKTIEQIGGYDENFPNGFGVDIDHSYRMWKAKLKTSIMNYWVDHHMMNDREHDNDPNTEQMKKESSEYFKKKWKL